MPKKAGEKSTVRKRSMSEKSRDIASDSPAQQTTATTQDVEEVAVKPEKG
jgi:hypothetical protein